MNEDILKGKWKKLKGETKVWWGHATGNPITELDGNKDKLIGWLQEHKGMAQEEAESEVRKLEDAKKVMESKSEEVAKKIKKDFDKLSHQDIADIDGNIEAWADKIKEKYNDSQEEANKKVKDFMEQFKSH